MTSSRTIFFALIGLFLNSIITKGRSNTQNAMVHVLVNESYKVHFIEILRGPGMALAGISNICVLIMP